MWNYSEVGLDKVMVLPLSRPAASRYPPDICIEIGSSPLPIQAKIKGHPLGCPFIFVDTQHYRCFLSHRKINFSISVTTKKTIISQFESLRIQIIIVFVCWDNGTYPYVV